jgi:hypothetical protein
LSGAEDEGSPAVSVSCILLMQRASFDQIRDYLDRKISYLLDDGAVNGF